MPVIQAVVTESQNNYDRFNIVTWTGVAAGSDGEAQQMAMSGDRSVQVDGVATITGSNDNVSFFTLNDTSGAPLVFAGAGLKQILEVTRYIKPISGGGPTTVVLLAKRQS